MPEKILNVYSENWSEEPFAISRGIEDNFDVVVVEITPVNNAYTSVLDTAGHHPRCNISDPPPLGIAILFSP